MIRKAELSDLESIMAIVEKVKREMEIEGRAQWNENYPQTKDFTFDIESENLYIHEINGQLSGFVCVNDIEPVEYKEVPWSVNDKALVIHRMAVDSNFRKQGIGFLLMRFAEELAQDAGVSYLKSDTYSLNPQMNALFRKLDYHFTGEIFFLGREKPFYCYEKVLG